MLNKKCECHEWIVEHTNTSFDVRICKHCKKEESYDNIRECWVPYDKDKRVLKG